MFSQSCWQWNVKFPTPLWARWIVGRSMSQWLCLFTSVCLWLCFHISVCLKPFSLMEFHLCTPQSLQYTVRRLQLLYLIFAEKTSKHLKVKKLTQNDIKNLKKHACNKYFVLFWKYKKHHQQQKQNNNTFRLNQSTCHWSSKHNCIQCHVTHTYVLYVYVCV